MNKEGNQERVQGHYLEVVVLEQAQVCVYTVHVEA